MQKFLVVDVEGAGQIDKAKVYDVGGVITDRNGSVYDTFSFLVSDIFGEDGETEDMQTAYYYHKKNLYFDKLNKGIIKRSTFANVKNFIHFIISKYEIKEFFAYNANYDRNALNNTDAVLKGYEYSRFLPKDVKVSCIWHMACQVICTQKSYSKFCLNNGYVSEKGNYRTSAEVVYSYITQSNFEEEHTGLEDAKIETQILARCFRQHKKMKRYINRWCWRIPNTKKYK